MVQESCVMEARLLTLGEGSLLLQFVYDTSLLSTQLQVAPLSYVVSPTQALLLA